MNEKFSYTSEDFIILTGKESWHGEPIQMIHQIYREFIKSKSNLLRVISLATAACSVICDYIQPALNNQGNEVQWMTIWKMTGFIHKNYEDKILIDDIATTGSICRSKYYELFNDYVKQTPIAYLTNYRIQKSCEMLRDTDASVCEIAMACGFQSANYFSQVFRYETGLTPHRYRLETK
jgi:AraC family transcriptional regulator, melibiose operon regulatory protein